MLAPAALNEHIKPLLVHLGENLHPQDRIYVYYGSGPAFRYYAPQFGFVEESYWIGAYNRDHPDQYLQEIERFAGSGRVWFLFSHNCSWCAVNEEAYILAHLEQLGQRQEALTRTNASMYLYDLR
jgi:hypothetical protein